MLNKNKPCYVIIVAGGKGARMGTELPKQFLSLCEKPILIHTLEAFEQSDIKLSIILVLPKEQQAYWASLCEKFGCRIPHQIADGGETRFHSVQNGLRLVPENALVGIHDGVRPLVSKDLIVRCYETAEKQHAAFPAIPVVDSLRKKTATGSVPVNRNDYLLVQTPQVFQSEIIHEAYRQPFSTDFTDDVSVLEAMGNIRAVAVAGSEENIKITKPIDLMIAELIKQEEK